MKWGNWIIGACCALFVAVIVTPTGVWEGGWKLASGDDAAAWVQAIGSMGAIAGAWLLGSYQSQQAVKLERWRRDQDDRAAVERRKEVERRHTDAIIAIAQDAFELTRSIDQIWVQGNLDGSAIAMLMDQIQDRRTIAVGLNHTEYPAGIIDEAIRVVAAIGAVRASLYALEPISAALGGPIPYEDSFSGLASELRVVTEELCRIGGRPVPPSERMVRAA